MESEVDDDVAGSSLSNPAWQPSHRPRRILWHAKTFFQKVITWRDFLKRHDMRLIIAGTSWRASILTPLLL